MNIILYNNKYNFSWIDLIDRYLIRLCFLDYLRLPTSHPIRSIIWGGM